MELPRRFSYNPSWNIILGAAVFFGGCSAFMAYKAIHNTVGLIINGIVFIGPRGATTFYWIISGLGGGFVLMAILLTLRRVANPRTLELSTDALVLPYGRFQSKTARIAYSDIQSVKEIEISGQRFFYVIASGLRYTVTASLFPDSESYDSVRDFLVSRARR
jgi:hypothetical protein